MAEIKRIGRYPYPSSRSSLSSLPKTIVSSSLPPPPPTSLTKWKCPNCGTQSEKEPLVKQYICSIDGRIACGLCVVHRFYSQCEHFFTCCNHCDVVHINFNTKCNLC